MPLLSQITAQINCRVPFPIRRAPNARRNTLSFAPSPLVRRFLRSPGQEQLSRTSTSVRRHACALTCCPFTAPAPGRHEWIACVLSAVRRLHNPTRDALPSRLRPRLLRNRRHTLGVPAPRKGAQATRSPVTHHQRHREGKPKPRECERPNIAHFYQLRKCDKFSPKS